MPWRNPGVTLGCFDTLGRVIPSTDTSAPGVTAITVKSLELLPDAVVTTSLPAPTGAPPGTDVVMDVALLAVMFAATPPIVTLAPVNPVPLMVTTVPGGPVCTEVELITGGTNVGAVTVNAIVAAGRTLPVTVMVVGPGVALGTVTKICVLLLPVTLAFDAPKLTAAPLRFVPLIVMRSSGAPLLGETLVMVGGDVAGGTGVVPQPPVVMVRALPVYDTVTAFAAQLTPFTDVVVCAPHTVATNVADARTVAASRRTVE